MALPDMICTWNFGSRSSEITNYHIKFLESNIIPKFQLVVIWDQPVTGSLSGVSVEVTKLAIQL